MQMELSFSLAYRRNIFRRPSPQCLTPFQSDPHQRQWLRESMFISFVPSFFNLRLKSSYSPSSSSFVSDLRLYHLISKLRRRPLLRGSKRVSDLTSMMSSTSRFQTCLRSHFDDIGGENSVTKSEEDTLKDDNEDTESCRSSLKIVEP
ncbi:unnamed protein product [Vicia faba]|uniref:Uncharacterized protein n=1 Tax=Vicia faba TaxID=3906 RepID=A0AAV0ZCM5_VICFA|nr:unnamed protein product [Vicia faba]